MTRDGEGSGLRTPGRLAALSVRPFPGNRGSMPTWKIDPDHSVAGFSVGHMMVNRVLGQFNGLAGTIGFTPGDPASLTAEAVIAAQGVHTGIAKRDEHLRSREFLEVEHFPQIRYRSSGARVIGFDSCLLAGQITIHGVSHAVEMEVQCRGPIQGTDGETTMGFAAKARLNREMFGLLWNVDLPGQGFVVGKELEITLHVEADLEE